MANKYLKIRVKQRFDTAENWKSTNPILLAGELAIESDTGFAKAGNGSSRYNDLTYLSSPSSGNGGKIIASIYEPDSEAWVEVDMEDVTIGAESNAWIEII